MERIISLLMFLVILIQFFTVAKTIGLKNENEVITIAEDYLKDSADYQYCGKTVDLEKYTVECLDDEKMCLVSDTIDDYHSFRSSIKDRMYEETSLQSGGLSVVLNNLLLNRQSLDYYRYIDRLDNTQYKYFTTTYSICRTIIEDDFAFVDLYEGADFEYTELDKPSFISTHFNVWLTSLEGKWFVFAVESDSEFYTYNKERTIDLESVLAGIYDAYLQNAGRENYVKGKGNCSLDTENDLDEERSGTTRVYRKDNAVNYALTYSSNSGALGTPSYRNNRFYYNKSDCMRFASQCVWAGFGGSNSQTDINNKYGMLTSGSKIWYCTKTSCFSTWQSTQSFKALFTNGNNNNGTGIQANVNEVSYDSNLLTGGSVGQSDLLGSVLLVKGTYGLHHHAVILTTVLGSTRQTVYFTAYNRCRENCKLSSFFPSSSNDSNDGIFIISPKYLYDANVQSGVYAFGELIPAQNNNTTVTVKGKASASVSMLKIDVYPPSSSTPAYSYTSHNSNTVSGTVYLNQTGEWSVVVSGTVAQTYTYVVRVK